MTSKLIPICVVCLFAVTELGAQPFMQSAGITFSYRKANIQIPINAKPYKASLYSAMITYFPRVNVMETDNSSLSIGVPFGLGIGKSHSSEGGPDGGFFLGADFPLVVDYNRGYKSSEENENKTGGYVGLGFGYSISGWDDGSKKKTLVDQSRSHASSYGPVFRGGVRVHSGMKNHSSWGYSVGLSFKPGFEKSKYKTWALSFLCDF